MAMPIAANRNTSARSKSTCAPTLLVKMVAMNVTATSPAAVTTHLSWSRSSPLERANLRASATKDSRNATGSAMMKIKNSTIATLPNADSRISLSIANGRAQLALASSIELPVTNTSKVPSYQATGRQRRLGTCPVGNRRNRIGSRQTGMAHTQPESQARGRPAGREPGSTSKARSA
jgi:hypothetical protein